MSKICSLPFRTLATHVVSGLQQLEDIWDDDDGVNWERLGECHEVQDPECTWWTSENEGEPQILRSSPAVASLDPLPSIASEIFGTEIYEN